MRGTLNPDLTIAVRILITGGFVLQNVQRQPGYALISAVRSDEFGAIHHYCFALSESTFSQQQIEAAKIASIHHTAQLILVGSGVYDVPTVTWDRFVNLFGGPIFSMSPLEPEFGKNLVQLGHNQMPVGLEGRADDLLELYVHAALEFTLGGRVIRYGQERRFEARPDGLAIPGSNFTALYDAKAYTEGYEVTIEAIRQFSSYVNEFKSKYEAYLPRLNSFLVISGSFPHNDEILDRRSRDFLAVCGVPLSFITAETLAQIVSLLTEHTATRRSINWSRIFTNPVVKYQQVESEVKVLHRDGIIRGA